MLTDILDKSVAEIIDYATSNLDRVTFLKDGRGFYQGVILPLNVSAYVNTKEKTLHIGVLVFDISFLDEKMVDLDVFFKEICSNCPI